MWESPGSLGKAHRESTVNLIWMHWVFSILSHPTSAPASLSILLNTGSGPPVRACGDGMWAKASVLPRPVSKCKQCSQPFCHPNQCGAFPRGPNFHCWGSWGQTPRSAFLYVFCRALFHVTERKAPQSNLGSTTDRPPITEAPGRQAMLPLKLK